jgi:hypothetical protein
MGEHRNVSGSITSSAVLRLRNEGSKNVCPRDQFHVVDSGRRLIASLSIVNRALGKHSFFNQAWNL